MPEVALPEVARTEIAANRTFARNVAASRPSSKPRRRTLAVRALRNRSERVPPVRHEGRKHAGEHTYTQRVRPRRSFSEWLPYNAARAKLSTASTAATRGVSIGIHPVAAGTMSSTPHTISSTPIAVHPARGSAFVVAAFSISSNWNNLNAPPASACSARTIGGSTRERALSALRFPKALTPTQLSRGAGVPEREPRRSVVQFPSVTQPAANGSRVGSRQPHGCALWFLGASRRPKSFVMSLPMATPRLLGRV